MNDDKRAFLPVDDAVSYIKGQIGYSPSPATLDKMVTVGGGPDYVKFGRKRLYHPDALDRWIQQKLQEPKPYRPRPRQKRGERQEGAAA
jgi:hypothetical protein